ncbi:MAG: DUF1599 domain-containing protein [Flavitalea sp.]
MSNTERQYDAVLHGCRDIFLKKTRDYGTSWRVLRPISITDQIFIKAQRIRTLQEKKVQKIDDNIESEFRAMVNYGLIGMIQLELDETVDQELTYNRAAELYDLYLARVRETMMHKNHDYGEAWRAMSQESFVDLILMKLMRIKQIISNDGKTIISEGIESNFIDIVNYSLFALILIGEGVHEA